MLKNVNYKQILQKIEFYPDENHEKVSFATKHKLPIFELSYLTNLKIIKMKKIIITLALILFTAPITVNANDINFAQNKTEQSKYISIVPDKINNVFLIRFESVSGNYVIIKIKCDGKEILTLVDGEVPTGNHGVYFKPAQDIIGKNFTCTMQVYDAKQNNLILSANELFSFNNLK